MYLKFNLLLFFSMGPMACGIHKADHRQNTKPVSYKLVAPEGLSLAATPLGDRLSAISFDVFVDCSGVNSNTKSVTDYQLGAEEVFTVVSDCQSPDVEITNVSVSYSNIRDEQVNATFSAYGDVFANNGSEMILEKVASGSQSVFRLRERQLDDNSDSSVSVGPKNVSAVMNSQANSYCSGSSVDPVGSVLTFNFENPEGQAAPVGDYSFVASLGNLPAGTTNIKNDAERSISLDFSAISAADIPGVYSFVMELIPLVGEALDDERCKATVTVTLDAAAADFEI